MIRYFAIIISTCCGLMVNPLKAQNCPNPIVIESITVLNSTCNNNSGGIVVKVAGDNNGLNFSWMPNTPGDNAIFNVPADAYKLTIKRNGNNCKLDTTIVVNNSDGPVVQVVNISPASCRSQNGRVILAPATLNYFWSDGGTGSVKDQLSAGCYTVTASATNGCFSVLAICVPTINNLQVTSQLLKPAKCNKPTGTVGLTISGGSGNYAYSLGTGSPTISGLTAGIYTCTVTDNTSGCKATTTFTVPTGIVKANVDLTTYNVKCPENNDGFVVFSVKPELNFELPYTFSLKNASTGSNASPGALPPGLYDLNIFDADGCSLLPASFLISTPPPFAPQTIQKAQDCNRLGELLLNLNGGNGKYIIDWADIPGTNNTEDRLNIPAGIYKATIYDSLFCEYTLPNVLIPNLCTKADTLRRFVETLKTDTFCLPLPTGVENGVFSLSSQSADGISNFGTWALQPNGCLIYRAKSAVGYSVDTVCVSVTTGVAGLTKSFCIIVSIDKQSPERDTLYFTVQRKSTAISCAIPPSNFKNYKISRADGKGLSGTSGSFGTYTIHPTNGCITFTALNQPGYFVDNICVAYYDQVVKQSYTVCYVPSVLPFTDCEGSLLPDSLLIDLSDCTKPAEICLPIPFTAIPGYTILNGVAPYKGSYSGCDPVNRTAYSVPNLSLGGPFTLNSWLIGTQNLGGVFANPVGLLALLNQLDPDGDWELRDNNTILTGGKTGQTYGNIKITSSTGVISNLSPAGYPISMGTKMQFNTGFHRVTFRRFNTGCIDTVNIRVRCSSCPPIHNFDPDAFDEIHWKTTRCALDTIFCTTIPANLVSQYKITDNGLPFNKFMNCGTLIGFKLDTGFHDLKITSPQNACQYRVKFYLDCTFSETTETKNIALMEEQPMKICLDTTRIPGTIFNMTRTCANQSKGKVDWSFDTKNKCVLLTGLNPGADTFCVQICNFLGACFTTQLNIKIIAEQDSLIAVPDYAYTAKNTNINIPLLENDVYAGSVQITLMNLPVHGQVALSASDGVVLYMPAETFCGTDSFSYRICSPNNSCSTATVYINVSCKKILIFNGISPNGDGENDTWQIPGIETFPDNEVRIFNRWGNAVFSAKRYSNDTPWNGTWDGKDLPDGTYYYLIDLGDTSEKLSGWIQLLR